MIQRSFQMSWLCLFKNVSAMVIQVSLLSKTAPAWGADLAVCEDMTKYACSAERVDDGTGSVQRTQPGRDQMVDDFDLPLSRKLTERNRRIATRFFEKDPKAILDALGLTDYPACKNGGANEKCLQVTSEELSLMMANQLRLPSPYKMNGMGSNLITLNGLLQDSEVVATMDWYQKSLYDKDPQLPTSEKKLAEMVPRIKELMVKKIQSLPIDEKLRTIMINRVKKVQFAGTNCDDKLVNPLYIANAYFNNETNEIQVCQGLLGKNFSEFTIAQTLAHEVTHSIDPCSMGTANQLVGENSAPVRYGTSFNRKSVDFAYPMSELLACLRSEKSVGASNWVDSEEGTPGPIDHCRGDQMGESLADWFSADVMAEYISKFHPHLTEEQWRKGVSNTFRQYCYNDGKSQRWDVHPAIRDRLNRLILQSPALRQKMGCTPSSKKYIYCDASNPDAIHNLISTPEQKRIEKIKSIRGVK